MQTDITDLAKDRAQLCSVFGNPSRVLILWALSEHELSVSDIALAIECSLQNTSQHLRLMRDKGILLSRRDGNAVYYRVNDAKRLAHCDLIQRAVEDDSAQK